MWCAANNHNYMCHICTKGFLDSNFNEAAIDKISNFHKSVMLTEKDSRNKGKTHLLRVKTKIYINTYICQAQYSFLV